jgi:hypothetical protein
MNLKPLVNDKPLWQSFLEELDERIAFCHKTLEQVDEPSQMYRLQGEIAALKKLKFLREKVNNG